MWVLGVVYIAAILSASLTLASTAINGYFASAVNADIPDLVALQCASVVSGALSFTVVCFLIFLLGRGRNIVPRLGKRWERCTYVLLATLLTGAAIVAAVALGWSYAGINELDSSSNKKTLQQLFFIWCGIWAGSCLLQISFYALFLHYTKNTPEKRLAKTLHEGVSAALSDGSPSIKSDSETERAESQQEKSEKYLELADPSTQKLYYRPDKPGTTPAISISVSYDNSGFEEKALLERAPSNPFSDSRRTSYEMNTPRSSSDTGRISRQTSGSSNTYQNQYQWSWNRGGGGGLHSRANSPESFTRPPTIPEVREEIRTPPPTYQRASSAAASRSRSTSTTTRRPRATSESSTVEDHIHPLFRSDSPTAPPNATRGTTVTASPIAGQTISMHAVQRIRAASASTPDLRSRSPLSRFTEGEDDDGDGGGDEDAPIPGFVLAANRRVSLDRYGKR